MNYKKCSVFFIDRDSAEAPWKVVAANQIGSAEVWKVVAANSESLQKSLIKVATLIK